MPLTIRAWCAAALLAGGGACRAGACEPDPAATLRRIAAGSCIREDRPQPVWRAVAAFEPDTILLLGDNVYGDTEDVAVLRGKYAALAADPGFGPLRERVPIVAVWDDHDYGANDAGREFPRRRESQQVFLDFFGVPADSPLRHRDGIYRSLVVGPPGRRVQFICLDTRFHRSALAVRPASERRRGEGPYRPTDDPEATILGAEQWRWLAAALAEPADIRILLSSIQVAATEHHWEQWGNFPAERARLLRMIRESGARGVFVVSGDRHSAELSRVPPGPDALAYPLYDLTASSLNQPQAEGRADDPNRLRLGPCQREPSFGTLEIDWDDAGGPAVTLGIRDVTGAVVHAERVRLGDLAPAGGR
ncbi:MAG: alkaline phosphatase family protein [Planctomycetia bacterium]|nr:alkaline phosphatase family protein [Planctomycetia bacterium]